MNNIKFWRLSVKSGVGCRSVYWLNWFWSSPGKSFLASPLFEICYQGFCSLFYIYVDESRESVFVCRRCVCCTAVLSLTAKFLLAFASTVILDSESRGTHDLTLRSGGSGTVLDHRWLRHGEGCVDNVSFIVHPCAKPLCISSYWIW
jgi:hypothetical protein